MTPPQGIGIPARRILSLALVAGYVDALGFFDLNEIYTAAMTGNTIQLGIAFVREQWAQLAVVGTTLGAFFCGALFSSFIRRRLPHAAWVLLIMAPLLLAAQAVRLFAPNPAAIELPLLAAVMAMQGETISRFGGVAIQTVVVTNNLLKIRQRYRWTLFAKRKEVSRDQRRSWPHDSSGCHSPRMRMAGVHSWRRERSAGKCFFFPTTHRPGSLISANDR
jgi:uncharacterized membrane protein YoaK (UPF0700 family)